MIVDKTRAALLEAIKRTGPSAMLLLMLGLHSNPAFSQDDDFWKSFREARQEMLDDFEKYRKTALMDYDNYLRSEWKKFKLCKADKRPNIPKPKEHPVCTNYILPEVDIVVEAKKPVSPVVPRPTIEKVKLPKQMLDLDAKSQQEIPDIEYTGSGIEQPLMPPVERIPIMPALPNVPFVHVPASKQMVRIDYFGESIEMQKVSKLPSMVIESTGDVAAFWKILKSSDLKEVTQAFATESRNMGLSDWASAMLVEKYIDEVMPKASRNEKILAVQYVLANCGYNVLLAMGGSQVSMLVPYSERVFEKTYIYMDGKRYYVYPDLENDGSIASCELPKDVELGKDMELRFVGKTMIGMETKPFHVSAAGITVSGEVPVGIMPILDHYPVVDIPTVASSVVDRGIRDQVVEQISSQVQGLSEQEAANRILHFVQKGFQYATDEEQFNREKYFYFEETLFYPKCDCEDRAIFYAYLVHEVLGLDVHLIQYPGHECTAVAFREPLGYGTFYEYGGKRYYICDTTYIGAKIGRCMPSYVKESPQIEVWY